MKKIFLSLAVVALLTACADKADTEEAGKGKTNTEEAGKGKTEKKETTKDYDSNISESSSSNTDCDEYLDGYEDFMDKYISVLKKYKADPSDMSIMTEYTALASKAQEWAGKTPDCSDASFIAKFSEIQMRMANSAIGM